VWRFGKISFCTFGIEYTRQQVRVIAKNFKRVFVAYDDDPQAVKQAKKLIADLKFRGVEAIFIPIVGDPANMSQKEANYLISQFITNQYI
jgi:DNA primase